MERDCNEGCDGDHTHKWEISPHYQSSDFDVLVTDCDKQAWEAIVAAAEMVFDDLEPGQERTITIKCNARITGAATP